MKTLAEMTKDERSTLVYLETRIVDHSGRVDLRHLNADDMTSIRGWQAEGFIQWGRVAHGATELKTAPMWVQFSDEAWTLAHEERRARAAREWAKRRWQTTEEKRNS